MCGTPRLGAPALLSQEGGSGALRSTVTCLQSESDIALTKLQIQKRPPYAGGLSSEWESAGLAYQQCAGHPDSAPPCYSRRRLEVESFRNTFSTAKTSQAKLESG